MCDRSVSVRQLLHLGGHLHRAVLRHLSATALPSVADSGSLLPRAATHLAGVLPADGAHRSLHQGQAG